MSLGDVPAIRPVGFQAILTWGVEMTKKLRTFLVLAAVLPLASCSGPKSGGGGGGGGGGTGNANVSVTLYDTPPKGVTLLSFSLPIVGISLTPASGSPVSIYSPTTPLPFELTRLETDSAAVVTAASVPAGTYTALSVTIGASSGVFVNYSGAAIGSCAVGGVCNLPSGAATTVTVPLSLTLTSNQNQWIGLDVNLSNAIVTTGGIGVDFTQAKTFAATTTVRTGLPTGAVDTIEDYIGTVTAVSSSSITVQSGMTGQSFTAAITASTEIDAAPSIYSNCNSATPSSCLVVGSVVSLDATLAAAGTFAATEIDILDVAATDEIEGVIYPTASTATTGIVGMILADKVSKTGNAVLGASTTTYGTGIFLTAGPSINYSMDTKTLTNAPSFVPFGFAGSGDLLAGQVIRAQVTGVTSNSSGISATATNVILRWSRVSATVNLVTGTSFTMTNIPAYISTLNQQLDITPQVYTYSPGTAFDGVTGPADTNFQNASVAIRALYLNNNAPAFQAAKVRVP